MGGIRPLGKYRTIITRVAFSYYLLLLIWRGYCHLLPFQLHRPALSSVHYDLSFWLYKLSGLSSVTVFDHTASLIFTSLVFLSCIIGLLFPLKRFAIVCFSLLYFILAITFNVYLTHSSHYLAGMVLLSVCFWPKEDRDFELLWEGMRYYTCWVYGSAFIWKVLLGAIFQWRAGELTFKANLAEYLYHNPSTITAGYYHWFLLHPFVLNLGHKLVFLVEGFLLAGFFTKKLDKWLIAAIVVINISIYIFSDVFFIELCILVITLIPAGWWDQVADVVRLRASRGLIRSTT